MTNPLRDGERNETDGSDDPTLMESEPKPGKFRSRTSLFRSAPPSAPPPAAGPAASPPVGPASPEPPSYEQPSYEQLMWRVRTAGEVEVSAAFAALVQRWQGPIRGLCTRMTGDLHRGEDLAQETFARLFVRRHQYEPTGRFSTFLWRIALNICHDELRKIHRRGETPLASPGESAGEGGSPGVASFEPESGEPGPDIRLVEAERAEAVRHALLGLSEPYRTVVVLRHYEGLKFWEIGDLLGIPEGTVKSRMSEAMNQLGRELSSAAGASTETAGTGTVPRPIKASRPTPTPGASGGRAPERLLI